MNIFSNHCIRKQTGMCCRTIESRFGKQLFEVKFIINLMCRLVCYAGPSGKAVARNTRQVIGQLETEKVTSRTLMSELTHVIE